MVKREGLPLEESALSRLERMARWNTLLFVPITGLGLSFIILSVHVLPLAFLYVGVVLAWPFALLTAEPFGGGGFRLLTAVIVQWVWCLVLWRGCALIPARFFR